MHPTWRVKEKGMSDQESMKRRLQVIAATGVEDSLPEIGGLGPMPAPRSEPRDGAIATAAEATVLEISPQTAEYRVQLETPMLLRRTCYQDGNWQASFRPASDGKSQGPWRSATVHKVDFLTQGVILPAGEWRLRFEYAPWWLLPSTGIALIGWLAVAATTFQYRND